MSSDESSQSELLGRPGAQSSPQAAGAQQSKAQPQRVPPQRRERDDDDEFAHLPKVFVTPDQAQVVEPVYRLLAQGFYDDILWPEGEILCTMMIPNENMEPLNRAAGLRMRDFIESLPGADGIVIRVDDMIEAAMMLRPREGEPVLSTEDWGRSVRTLAIKLQRERGNRQNLKPLSPIGVSRAARPGAPPIPNAVYEDRQHKFGNQATEAMRASRPQPGSRSLTQPAMGNGPRQV